MERLTLTAKQRKTFGKKVKSLRSAGELPGNVYGKGISSQAVAVEARAFKETLKTAGETGVVYLAIEGEEGPRPVLIHGVQAHPVTSSLTHIDFYQVNLKEKTTANVPVTLTGENNLEKIGEGLILQTLSEIEVEALPTDIPHEFEVDVSRLTEVGQTFKVGDLQYDREKVEVKIGPEENILVMQTAEMKEEEVVEEAVSEEGVEPEVISETEAAERAAASGEAGETKQGEEPPK